MHIRHLVIIAMCCVSSLYLYSNSFSLSSSFGSFKNVTFVKNYDGDTITVNIPYAPPIIGENISVRVFGIDTPEIKGACPKEKQLAKDTKNYVKYILSKASYIDLEDVKRDKYFRILATVKTSEGDLAELLLDKGYAVEYDGGTKSKNWCE